MIAGIDEAGKGAVLGSMCVAGVLLHEKKLDILNRLGIKDSKKLTPKQRRNLADEIKRLAAKHHILVVSAFQIDELRKVMNMNEIMVICYVKVLEQLKPDHVFVDAADVDSERFAENIRKRYKANIVIKSEHDADEKYSIVGAASILAKVHRDMLIKEIEKQVGIKIGSGYPSDLKTIRFLEEWIHEHGKLPDFARSSWKTSKRVMEKYKKSLSTFT